MKYRLAKIVIKFVKAITVTDTPTPRPATLHSCKTTSISNNTTPPPLNRKNETVFRIRCTDPRKVRISFPPECFLLPIQYTKDITDKLHSVLHKKDGGKSTYRFSAVSQKKNSNVIPIYFTSIGNEIPNPPSYESPKSTSPFSIERT